MEALPLWKPYPLWPLPPNPYRNTTPRPSALEKCKWLLVGLTLFLPRLLVVVVTILLAWLVALISVAGWPRGAALRADLPLPNYGWRRLLQRCFIPALVRINLFAAGFHNIRITGKLAPRAEAPIVVCNHQSFPDIWFFLWQCLPVGVSALENLRFPVMGDLQASQQTIFVDREDRDSGAKAARLIDAIARDARWPRLVIYPEGNTNNGRQLCAFKMGPFQPGLQVQPLVIDYGARRAGRALDPCWVEPLGMPVHILALRLMLQWRNEMSAHWLPVMTPSEAERAQPALFAARVQAAMAEHAGIPVTEFSFTDTRLLFAARKLRLPPDTALLEADKAARLWSVSYADCREVLERFAAAGGPGATQLDAPGLLSALALRMDGAGAALGARLLATLRQGEAGEEGVTYRELVAGLAPLAAAGRAAARAAGVPQPTFMAAVQAELGRLLEG